MLPAQYHIPEASMSQHFFLIAKLPRSQRGLTTVEYAIAGGLIAAGIIAAFVALGGHASGVISAINSAFTAAGK